MRSSDVSAMDYFRAAPAGVIGTPVFGPLIPLQGISAWSCTIYSDTGAKADVTFQFSDFHGRCALSLPNDPAKMMVNEVTTSIAGSVGTPAVVRAGRFGDSTCGAAVMRIFFTPTTGSLGNLWAALTLRAQ